MAGDSEFPAVPAEDLPLSDAAHDPGDRHTDPAPRDVLRRVPDLLAGDLIAYGGQIREVASCGFLKHSPSEAFLLLVGDPVSPETGRPVARKHGTETRVRVLRSFYAGRY